MAPATYTFRSEWTVPLGVHGVYDLLEDVAGYPRWWPQVRAVARLDESTALVACRALLPYTLHVELSPRVRDRAAGVLEASLDGDLVGRSRWSLTPADTGAGTGTGTGTGTGAGTGTGTRMVYDQRVRVSSTLLRGLSRLARPVLEANHGAMMRGALRGLAGSTAR